ncbi:MAG: hypothetical protein MUF42_08510 [Cytophagaceae bacterium]|jgi:hypothetical protein|nr:hypothetical protein [Cytophagaceae bacterium]
MGKLFLFSIISFLVFISSCSDSPKIVPVSTGWYFWKTTLDTQQTDFLQAQALKGPVYIRVMDVAWDDVKQKTHPVAPLRAQRFPSSWMPVVYIKNEVFYHLDSTGVDSLSTQLLQYLSALVPYHGWHTLQIDCDWTVRTRDRYFWFLSCVRLQLPKQLSVTIRLHQLKQKTNIGIPPVGHGVLMCYNMQLPSNLQTPNSIYQLSILKSYGAYIDQYPLDLDIAFPLYSWAVVFRNKKFYSLVNELEEEACCQDCLQPMEGNWRKVIKGFTCKGFRFQENDELRIETPSEEDLSEGIQFLLAKSKRPTHLIWFHADEPLMAKRKKLLDMYEVKK